MTSLRHFALGFVALAWLAAPCYPANLTGAASLGGAATARTSRHATPFPVVPAGRLPRGIMTAKLSPVHLAVPVRTARPVALHSGAAVQRVSVYTTVKTPTTRPRTIKSSK